MQTNSFSDLRQLLSTQRIESYRNTSGTDEDCVCRYLWNTALAESLHPVLHVLEVTFRNAVDRKSVV